VLQFQSPPPDGVATEAGDFDQALDAAPTTLERQQTNEPPPISLIERGQHPIDRPMVFRHGAIGMLPTHCTGTDMTGVLRLCCHRRSALGLEAERLALDSHHQERAYYKIVKLFSVNA
jgi:hypothetical protein